MPEHLSAKDVVLAVVLTAGAAGGDSQDLPPLPSHASGVECTVDDGIDRSNRDFMREKIDEIIESGEIFDDGWKVAARGYKIPYMFSGHNNLEIIRPDGQMFASLDTQQIHRETGEIKGYFPDGEYAAPVVDDCMKGNTVVMPENLEGQTVVFEGKGAQAFLVFAKAAESANGLAKADYSYKVFPDQHEREANSNSFARSFVEVAAGRDIYTDMLKYAENPLFGSPGLDVDLIREIPESRYAKIEDPDDLLLNEDYYSSFLSDLRALHPISQQERAMQFYRQPTQGDDVSVRDVWKVLEGAFGLPRP